MKTFKITGELYVDDLSHQELLEYIYDMLKKKGIHFSGETKQIIAKNT